MDFVSAYVTSLWNLLLDTGLWLIAGLALAGVVHAAVPAGLLERHLGGRGIKPILKASLLGIPLPLCSCSVIPVAAGLRRGGAGKGASAAFAISTPQTGEESIPLTWAMFGPAFALARPVIAVVTAFTAGILIDRFAGDHRPKAAARPPTRPCCGAGRAASGHDVTTGRTVSLGMLSAASSPVPPPAPGNAAPSCCSTRAQTRDAAERLSLPQRARVALRHGFVTMALDLAPWLTVGLLLAALVSALVPQNWIADHVGAGILPMLAMLVVGLPLYVCATSSTPLAATLVAAGLSPGAALVLLLAGPATNVATMSWLLKDLGARALAIYLAVIAAVAVAAGLAFDALLASRVNVMPPGHAHAHGASPVAVAFAAALALLMLWALGVRLVRHLRSRAAEPGHAAAPGHACH